MAIYSTIVCSPDPVQFNQNVNASVVIYNTGGSAVTVNGIHPYAYYTSAGATNSAAVAAGMGSVNLGPGVTTSVGASASGTFPFSVVFFAPSTGVNSDVVATYSIGCQIYTSDGSVTVPTADTVTVNYLPSLA